MLFKGNNSLFDFSLNAQTVSSSLENRTFVIKDYSSIKNKLSQTNLPIRLPSYIPMYDEDWLADNDENLFYTKALTISPAEYDLALTRSPKCTVPMCQEYTIQAQLLRPSSSSLFAFVSQLNPIVDPERLGLDPDVTQPQALTLAEGTNAYFLPRVCSGRCQPAKIAFDYDGVRYYLTDKGGTFEELTKMANSILLDPVVNNEL